jgi:hypothetical protein
MDIKILSLVLALTEPKVYFPGHVLTLMTFVVKGSINTNSINFAGQNA